MKSVCGDVFLAVAGSEPAEVVGVREVCGELDFSVHVLHSHDVFRTFIPHFAGPVDEKTRVTRFSIQVTKAESSLMEK